MSHHDLRTYLTFQHSFAAEISALAGSRPLSANTISAWHSDWCKPERRRRTDLQMACILSISFRGAAQASAPYSACGKRMYKQGLCGLVQANRGIAGPATTCRELCPVAGKHTYCACSVVLGDAWPFLLSPCNTCSVQVPSWRRTRLGI